MIISAASSANLLTSSWLSVDVALLNIPVELRPIAYDLIPMLWSHIPTVVSWVTAHNPGLTAVASKNIVASGNCESSTTINPARCNASSILVLIELSNGRQLAASPVAVIFTSTLTVSITAKRSGATICAWAGPITRTSVMKRAARQRMRCGIGPVAGDVAGQNRDGKPISAEELVENRAPRCSSRD